MTVHTERLMKHITIESLECLSECQDHEQLTACSTSGPSSVSSDPESQSELVASRNPPTTTGLRKMQHERSDSYQIRSRLLNKLGIEKEYAGHVAPRAEVSRVVQMGEDGAFDVPLKADYGLPERPFGSSNSLSSLASSLGVQNVFMKQPSKRVINVSFHSSVKVHPIPARSDYSQRMRSVMWFSNTEIQQNAARNSLEFAAEQWDVAKVVEDEDMVVYAGELVHPIHFVEESELDQHFNGVMATSSGE